MIPVTPWRITLCVLAFLAGAPAGAQGTAAPLIPSLEGLGLTAQRTAELQADLTSKDLRAAEALLLADLPAGERTPHAAALLRLLGAVYFRAGDTLQAAVAWKRADSIVPLAPDLRFSLAMEYVRLGHPEWARPDLVKLAAQKPDAALYPYWLGRLDYDAQHYDVAVAELQHAIQLDPSMARAHDSLGLCLFYTNRNAPAEAEFHKAIELAGETLAGAWPHTDLGTALAFQGKGEAAIAEFQHALALDPKLPATQFALGNALERQNNIDAAKRAFQAAATLDPNYPEPHVALARLLRREGNSTQAKHEVELYEQLRTAQKKGAPAVADAPHPSGQH